MNGTTALVTGATGFVGRHLVGELLKDGWTVWALDRVEHPHEDVQSIRVDLKDPDQVWDALEKSCPSVIIHLAAMSSVGASFKAPVTTLENNLIGAANLLYAAAELEPMPRALVIGSSEEYGRAPLERLPLTENEPLAPLSPYGVSKAAQSLLALSLFRSKGLPAVVLRPFNHTGPGQPPAFVVPTFARQIARIEAGLEEPVMRVGNLTSKRDFTDVRDMVRAYALAARAAAPGEVYNLGSGRSVTIQWVLEELLKRTDAKITVEPDPDRMMPSDITDVRADATKFAAATGWRPQIELEQTLQDVLDYWRGEASREWNEKESAG